MRLMSAGLCALALCASQGLADENRLFILQDNASANPLGNTLFVDQSLATNSTISGLAVTPGTEISDLAGIAQPATQRGGENFADIRITNSGGQVALNQTNLGLSGSNTGEISLSALQAVGILAQTGFGNAATLSVLGDRSIASIEQVGNQNIGTVDVTGSDAAGRLVQIGNGNQSGLTVSGIGAFVTLTQNGNNIVSSPTVITNAGPIIINQSN